MYEIPFLELIDKKMNEYGIQYACIATIDGSVFYSLGDNQLLEYPDFPKRFFDTKMEIDILVNYLEGNLLPRMISQGNVRSIMGFSESKDFVFSLFLNSKYDAKQHYQFARKIYDEIISS